MGTWWVISHFSIFSLKGCKMSRKMLQTCSTVDCCEAVNTESKEIIFYYCAHKRKNNFRKFFVGLLGAWCVCGKAHAVVCPNNIQIRVSLANHHKKPVSKYQPRVIPLTRYSLLQHPAQHDRNWKNDWKRCRVESVKSEKVPIGEHVSINGLIYAERDKFKQNQTLFLFLN